MVCDSLLFVMLVFVVVVSKDVRCNAHRVRAAITIAPIRCDISRCAYDSLRHTHSLLPRCLTATPPSFTATTHVWSHQCRTVPSRGLHCAFSSMGVYARERSMSLLFTQTVCHLRIGSPLCASKAHSSMSVSAKRALRTGGSAQSLFGSVITNLRDLGDFLVQ